MSGINQNGTNPFSPNVVPSPFLTQNQKLNQQSVQEATHQHAQQQSAENNQATNTPASSNAAAALMSLVQGSLKAKVEKFTPTTGNLNSRTVSVLAKADFDTMFRELADEQLTEEGFLVSGDDRTLLLNAATSRFMSSIDDLA